MLTGDSRTAAIHGGSAMRRARIPTCRWSFRKAEDQRVSSGGESQWWTGTVLPVPNQTRCRRCRYRERYRESDGLEGLDAPYLPCQELHGSLSDTYSADRVPRTERRQLSFKSGRQFFVYTDAPRSPCTHRGDEPDWASGQVCSHRGNRSRSRRACLERAVTNGGAICNEGHDAPGRSVGSQGSKERRATILARVKERHGAAT